MVRTESLCNSRASRDHLLGGQRTVTLQPGEALVREISFDPQLWQGWPEITSGTKLQLKVIYQTAPDPKVDSWSGKVSSKELTVRFR